MPVIVAFLDASVLYPAPLRDLLLELAVSDFYRAKWSEAVHDEWIRAAAKRGDSDVVVTANLKDFPASVLATHGLKAEHPDGFLARFYRESPSRFLEALERVRTRLHNPPVSRQQHLDALRRAGLNAVTELLAASSSTRPQPR